jgi:hypothetical protein
MSWGAWSSAVGLVLDIFGVIGLFFYGLPAEASSLGKRDPVFETHVPDKVETRKFKRYQRRSRVPWSS